MKILHRLTALARNLLGRGRVERTLDAELGAHLDLLVDERVAAGVDRATARRQALVELEGAEQIKEQVRDVRAGAGIDQLWRDLRLGVRLLRRSPGFAAVAIASLALGIGANTAIFQLLDAVRLRALPVAAPADLAIVRIANREWLRGNYGGRYADLTNPQWEQLHARATDFAGLAAWSSATFDLAPSGEQRFTENGLWVSGEFFDVLGIRPARGRLFTAADDVRGCGAPGVVISHTFWQQEFGGADRAIGATISIDRHPLTIVGVAPAGFFGVEVGRAFDVALPLCADRLLRGEHSRLDNPSEFWLGVIGRRAPGISLDRVTADLTSLSPGIFAATQPPDYNADLAKTYRGFRLAASSGASGFSQVREQYDTPLWLLLGLAGIVLLLACANLVNLLLARTAARAHEMSVRLALGASRGRLVRQLLVESLLLSAIGAAAGAWLAPALGRGLVALMGSDLNPMFVDLSTNWRMVGFAAALAVVTCVLFGLAPAWRAGAAPPGDAMKAAGRALTPGRAVFSFRRGLLVGQVALSLVLVVGGLLFGRSLFNLLTVHTGFQQAGVLEADISIPDEGVPAASRGLYFSQLAERIREVPRVRTAAVAMKAPLSGSWYKRVFIANPKDQGFANFNSVGQAYFDTMRIPLVDGRDFDQRDTEASPKVVIVNETFARRYFHDLAVVGRTFQIESRGEPGPTAEIVGLVKDTKYADLREDYRALVYLAASQSPGGTYGQILISTDAPFDAVMPGIRTTINASTAGVSFHFHDVQALILDSLRQDRVMAMLCGFFALLGAIVATIGVYGVSAYAVTERHREIGIRLALGASRRGILGLILGETGWLLGLGLAIGAGLAWGSARFAATLLFGLQPGDPITLASGMLLLGAAALVAAIVPARRASRIDPMRSLRTE